MMEILAVFLGVLFIIVGLDCYMNMKLFDLMNNERLTRLERKTIWK